MGASFFISEKETENLLQVETRSLPMPGGGTKPVSMSKLHWQSYGFILQNGFYDTARLVELANMNCREMGYSFDTSFPDVVAFVHRKIVAAGLADGN